MSTSAVSSGPRYLASVSACAVSGAFQLKGEENLIEIIIFFRIFSFKVENNVHVGISFSDPAIFLP